MDSIGDIQRLLEANPGNAALYLSLLADEERILGKSWEAQGDTAGAMSHLVS